ncbi:MAG: intradiol ring-cleavage dioxygenase [Alphaproteobacteria bacterium]
MTKRKLALSRRRMIQAGLAGGALALTGMLGGRQGLAAARLAPTPTQSLGPFYPDTLPAEYDNDLVRVAEGSDAAGQVVHVLGTVRGTDGEAIPGARVEIWQCDADGLYHHPRQRGAADPAFQGYGVTPSGLDGAYRFRTIHPVPYTGRTPHIHVMVSAPGMRRLVTQLYVEGAPGNERDFLFSRLAPEQQAMLLVRFAPAPEIEPNALAGTFDIVVEPEG